MRKSVIPVVFLMVMETAFAGDQTQVSSPIILTDELRELQSRGADVLVLDARDRRSYDVVHIEGAELPLSDETYAELDLFKQKVLDKSPDTDASLAQRMGVYPKDTPIVTYCSENCGASAHLQRQLIQLGFTDVRALKPGIQEWEGKGYPVVRSAAQTPTDQQITA